MEEGTIVKVKGQLVMWLFLASMLSVAQMPRLAAQVRSGASSTATVAAQTAPQADSQAVSSPPAVIPALPVPRLVKFSGVVKDDGGLPRSGVVGLSFSVYKSQEGGSALWMETQNVELDAQGNYTVLLGSTQSEGMPMDLFSTGEPRWLGVKVELNNEVEQARVLLVSVPYALKASDADTLGGKPASAYLLAPQQASGTGSTQATTAPASGGTAATATSTTRNAKAAVTPSVNTNYIPMFTNSSGTLGNSAIYQSSTGNIGIGYTNPLSRLVVGAPTGGGVLNASNLSDQDMQITLSAPGATDKHAFFGASTATNLTLGVGGVEKMRITNAGNVGIGYSNPQQRLVIGAPTGGGIVNASNLSDQDMQITLSAPGATDKHAFFGASTATNLTLGVASTEMMRITSTGNVGIGTSTPVSTLDVQGSGVNTTHVTSTTTTDADAVDAFSGNSNATTVYANASSTTGAAWGVEGYTASSASDAYGVIGYAGAGTGDPIGVYGQVAAGGTGVGTFGQYGTVSATGGSFMGANGAGVWGDGGGTQGGVWGTTDDSFAGVFENNSAVDYTLWVNNNATGYPLYAYSAGGGCYIDTVGNINCTGAKNAVVPMDGGKRTVALSAIESPQNWFEDAGSAHLVNGGAVVQIDPDFMQTVNTGQEYQVFLTPYGDCKGLYVTDRTANSFTVHELGGGTASLSFGYRIMALRKNYETIRFADHTKDQEVAQQTLARLHGPKPTGNVSHTPRKPISHAPRQISLSSASPHNIVK